MLGILACAVAFQSPLPTRIDLASLESRLKQTSNSFAGRLGIYVKDLKSGQTINVRADERFPSASTIKTVVMLEAFRRIEAGEMKWNELIELPPVAQRNASMWAYHLKDGTKINVDGLVHLMMNVSDNTTTVMLSRRLGAEKIERSLLNQGYKDTAVTIGPHPESKRLNNLRTTYANMGVTSPAEMGRILESIHLGKAASPAACEKMIRILRSQYWDDFISWIIPTDVTVASKVGALNRSRSDTAIVYGENPYILTIYTDSQKDRRWTDDNAGNEVIRKVSGIVWAALNPNRPYKPKPGAERWYPTGGGVE